jgi:hypothetical protein
VAALAGFLNCVLYVVADVVAGLSRYDVDPDDKYNCKPVFV